MTEKKRLVCEAKTEEEMCKAEVPWPETEEDLLSYIRSLVEREHDYGTCVYAMSMAALATFHYVGAKLGVTGFQASYAELDFLKRSRRMKYGFRIINYENLLYPQYFDHEHFPSALDLVEQHKEWLAGEAKRLLEEKPDAAPAVREHWRWLASLA